MGPVIVQVVCFPAGMVVIGGGGGGVAAGTGAVTTPKASSPVARESAKLTRALIGGL